jgi:hypothetical protein
MGALVVWSIFELLFLDMKLVGVVMPIDDQYLSAKLHLRKRW